ncbi:MAG: hypothetical protein IKD53_04520 [Clostridia bacterium]|nr:hypothetical protein [Clostridia bacterium]
MLLVDVAAGVLGGVGVALLLIVGIGLALTWGEEQNAEAKTTDAEKGGKKP